ncbi:heparan-alpha-glucosaminide N-acetyltransferase domain-containing protein [Nocardioides panzhihuensis]|uniref:NADH:ubiquinone oxidoreductase subunit 6 (Subunit J) n=1 Tax=Nocardioides panzhihuensis TaxID=860243 RepID=A0A7Z0IUD4_9ACTN|nr:heparan-alpha-glucosaminide N-acetyltransferase domain-containing protein [Nocardioides panzhihuensis]NYI79896.1 NADH:ubiquinone oxidoreductase subunit 6 (subunit J) [Nocardioides panzhihuensis]
MSASSSSVADRLSDRLSTRLVGVDAARCLALLGMMATHVLDPVDASGELTRIQEVAGGRSAALFAVLAGVSLALMTGRQTPVRGWALGSRSLGLAARAVLIAALGLVLGSLGTDIAIILTYYGMLFLIGIPFLGLRARWLWLLGAAWIVVGPLLSLGIRPLLPPRQFDSPEPSQLLEPGRLLAELLFTGYYPAVPWLAYLLIGMAVGRIDLRNRIVVSILWTGGVIISVSATWLSGRLTRLPSVAEVLLRTYPGTDIDSALTEMSHGLYGQTPIDGGWQWLLVVAPHSTTPFDLAQTIGSSMFVIGACQMIALRLPDRWRVGMAVLFGAGTMTLTLYSLHVVMMTDAVWPPETPGSYVVHVLVVLGIGALVTAWGRPGPLEWLVGRPAAWLRRLE